MKLEKRFKNSSGDLLVRETQSCGIVEIMHLYDNNESGCVIGCWTVRKVDGEDMAEFASIHRRIAETKYDSSDILLDAIKIGQKFADLIIDLKTI